MPHSAQWHVLDTEFGSADMGLNTPVRRLAHGQCRLAIANLDRSDPPGYIPGGVPRSDFNANLFHLTAHPRMPAIRVSCAVDGFDPITTPIQWRLVCRHVSCRYANTRLFRYRSSVETFETEWRGESRTRDFTLFGDRCQYAYNSEDRVLGGHGLLIVVARTPETTLCDYVHVRIAGTNPSQADVFAYLDEKLAGYDPNVQHMVRALFQHESAFTQFAAHPQRTAALMFTRRHHADGVQPDCCVRVDWPDDPPGFPLTSFDFGVGLSQFSRVDGHAISADLAWDWRENVRRGTNLFLGKLHRRLQPDITWKHLALAGWAAYNGSGEAAERYAQRLALSEHGANISFEAAPLEPLLSFIEPPVPLRAAGPWVGEGSPLMT
jgi:hypothetical protein